ncbi:hypothetical protein [Candidatus Ruminimicrobiellum ovillum]|uniref:hypothetical protein n=1 Tax=Candidatus Ruminimicrobiellum ovillum TaxID=1947927 RepID=UPI003559980C
MTTIQEKIEIKKQRLEAYRSRELEMLSGGVQSYGIGTRNVNRYQTDLTSIQNMIKQLEKDIEALERQVNGKCSMPVYRFVPGDN